ncbi:hypothetical protein PR118_000597 [Bacillus atrophaeus]|nr:hypothetical protein [Bacillus atrophaeus]
MKSRNSTFVRFVLRAGRQKLLERTKFLLWLPLIIEEGSATMPNLTKRQEDALQAISNPLNQYGVAPTHRELMEELGLRSTSSVKGLLDRLK